MSFLLMPLFQPSLETIHLSCNESLHREVPQSTYRALDGLGDFHRQVLYPIVFTKSILRPVEPYTSTAYCLRQSSTTSTSDGRGLGSLSPRIPCLFQTFLWEHGNPTIESSPQASTGEHLRSTVSHGTVRCRTYAEALGTSCTVQTEETWYIPPIRLSCSRLSELTPHRHMFVHSCRFPFSVFPQDASCSYMYSTDKRCASCP